MAKHSPTPPVHFIDGFPVPLGFLNPVQGNHKETNTPSQLTHRNHTASTTTITTTTTSTQLSTTTTFNSSQLTTTQFVPSTTSTESNSPRNSAANDTTKTESKMSKGLLIGITTPLAILSLGFLIGLFLFMFRCSLRRRRNNTPRSILKGDLEDQSRDFWLDREGKKELERNSSDAGRRQMDKLNGIGAQWGNTTFNLSASELVAPEQGAMRDATFKAQPVLAPLRRPPSIMVFPVPLTPAEIDGHSKFYVVNGHSRSPSMTESEDSTLSYVSYKDDAAYANANTKAPVTGKSSISFPTPTAKQLQTFRFPRRPSSSSSSTFSTTGHGGTMGIADGGPPYEESTRNNIPA